MCIPLQSAITFHLSSYLIPVLNLVVLIVALDDEAGYLASGFICIPTRDTHITSDIHITVTASLFLRLGTSYMVIIMYPPSSPIKQYAPGSNQRLGSAGEHVRLP